MANKKIIDYIRRDQRLKNIPDLKDLKNLLDLYLIKDLNNLVLSYHNKKEKINLEVQRLNDFRYYFNRCVPYADDFSLGYRDHVLNWISDGRGPTWYPHVTKLHNSFWYQDNPNIITEKGEFLWENDEMEFDRNLKIIQRQLLLEPYPLMPNNII